jgi:hypothetical protein
MNARLRPSNRPPIKNRTIRTTTVNLEPDVRAWLVKQSEETQRPMSYLINNIIRAYAQNPTVPSAQLALKGLDFVETK